MLMFASAFAFRSAPPAPVHVASSHLMYAQDTLKLIKSLLKFKVQSQERLLPYGARCTSSVATHNASTDTPTHKSQDSMLFKSGRSHALHQQDARAGARKDLPQVAATTLQSGSPNAVFETIHALSRTRLQHTSSFKSQHDNVNANHYAITTCDDNEGCIASSPMHDCSSMEYLDTTAMAPVHETPNAKIVPPLVSPPLSPDTSVNATLAARNTSEEMVMVLARRENEPLEINEMMEWLVLDGNDCIGHGKCASMTLPNMVRSYQRARLNRKERIECLTKQVARGKATTFTVGSINVLDEAPLCF